MRIAIDCRMLNNSGIGNVLKSILYYLPVNYEYLLIGNKYDLDKFKKNNISIMDCNIPIFSIKELLFFPVREVNKCDIFLSPNYNLPARIRCPKFCFIHDLVYLDVPGLTSKIGVFIRYLFALRSVLISKIVFTDSDFSMQRIIHYFGHKKKIRKIIISIPLKLRELLPNFKKAKQNYFIFVGNVKKHKGLSTLVKAFELYNDNETKLYIVGKKENFKTAFSEIEQQKNPNIIFTGWVEDEELYSLINNAKALIQPSLYEGFGIPPLEALYLKTPVILSDISVFKEVYNDLPVTFFKCNNSEDLKSKMLSFIEVNINNSMLDQKFNFMDTINILFTEFEKKK